MAASLIAALAGCLAVVPVALNRAAAPAATPARPWPAAAACPTPARARADGAAVLALVNSQRRQAGLPPLAASPGLTRAAQAMACDLAAQGDIGHRGSDGSTLAERLRRNGVAAGLMAENVASGQQSPEAVVQAWMASPHHRANILRPGLGFLGLGLADGAQPVWVLDLAS